MKKETIIELLLEDKEVSWEQDTENKNCFFDKKLGAAFYIYDDKIKYWEDIRGPFVEHKIPRTKKQLYKIYK